MWKYVGRRLKDTAELTYNLRSTFSTCSPEALRAKQKASQVPSSQDDHDKYIRKCSQPNQQLKRNPFITDKQWVIEEYYRNQKQKQQQQQAFNGWLELGLLKWVSNFFSIDSHLTWLILKLFYLCSLQVLSAVCTLVS